MKHHLQGSMNFYGCLLETFLSAQKVEDAWVNLLLHFLAVGIGLLIVAATLLSAMQDFSGWRVNYDTVLLALAQLTNAPETPWINHAP